MDGLGLNTKTYFCFNDSSIIDLPAVKKWFYLHRRAEATFIGEDVQSPWVSMLGPNRFLILNITNYSALVYDVQIVNSEFYDCSYYYKQSGSVCKIKKAEYNSVICGFDSLISSYFRKVELVRNPQLPLPGVQHGIVNFGNSVSRFFIQYHDEDLNHLCLLPKAYK